MKPVDRRFPRRRYQGRMTQNANKRGMTELSLARRSAAPIIPPQLPGRPGQTRWVRIVVSSVPASALTVSPQNIFRQDRLDYSSAAIRWNTARFLAGRVYPPYTAANPTTFQSGAYSAYIYSISPAAVTGSTVNLPTVLVLETDGVSNTIGNRPRPMAWHWGTLDASAVVDYTATQNFLSCIHTGQEAATTSEDWVIDILTHFID
jgi:hypothetical protein